MFIYLMFLLSLACDYSGKYWCDSFNGHSSCYSHVLCSTYGSPMFVSDSLSSKFESSLSSFLEGTDCSYSQYKGCTDYDWDDYSECVYDSMCEELLTPSFLSALPEDLWVAIKAKGLLEYLLQDEDFDRYRKFQNCLGRCEDVCEASFEDQDEECVENCILTFCV